MNVNLKFQYTTLNTSGLQVSFLKSKCEAEGILCQFCYIWNKCQHGKSLINHHLFSYSTEWKLTKEVLNNSMNNYKRKRHTFALLILL